MPTIVITKLKARLLSNMGEDGKPVSQNAVAAATGINPNTLSQLANGRILFRPRHLEALCRYFQCEPNDLAGSYQFDFPE
jgi:DNA-binding Xre family transcriptional regulator